MRKSHRKAPMMALDGVIVTTLQSRRNEDCRDKRAEMMQIKKLIGWITIAAALIVGVEAAQAQPKPKPPNILVIWGDDIGWQNVSAYGLGTMGYTTPNIDRIGMDGIRFTDHYAQPSSACRPRRRASPK
jgi:hypothetical protein